MRSFICIILSVLMFCSTITGLKVTASAVETANTSEDYEYQILDDGTVEIIEYWGDEPELEIPSIIDTYTVTSIGEDAFYNKGINSVVIPGSVISIGDSAFGYCGLSSVIILDGVKYIEDAVFAGNENLTSISIPDSVTYIGTAAFSGCDSLSDIKLSKNIKEISSSLFVGCDLTSIEIPDGVIYIGDEAFTECYYLSSVIIPDSVTSIGAYAFSNCESLTSVTIPSSVTNIGPNIFSSCDNLKICGNINSQAHKYANKYKIPFVPLEKTKIKLSVVNGRNKIYPNDKTKIKATITNKLGKTQYVSSNRKIATVNSKGKVTAKKSGKVVITVSNNGVSKKTTIIVKKPCLNSKKIILDEYETFVLKINGKIGKAIYKSSNKNVATVNKKGQVKAMRSGKAIIIVKNNRMTFKCKVTVRALPI